MSRDQPGESVQLWILMSNSGHLTFSGAFGITVTGL